MNNNKYLISGLVAVALLVIGLGYLKTSKTSPKNSGVQVQENIPSVSNVYTNTKYSYSFEIPSGWEVLGSTTDSSIGLTTAGNKMALIRIDASNMVFDERGKIPFNEYVKTAASSEIQNYGKLASLKEVTTKSGVVGYETTWNVSPPPGVKSATNSVSDPMTYFPLTGNKRLLIAQEIDYPKYSSIYEILLKSLKFTF